MLFAFAVACFYTLAVAERTACAVARPTPRSSL